MSFLFQRVRYLLIDMDGVLFRGSCALPGANDFLMWLRGQRIGFMLVTNNATRTPEDNVRNLAAMGMEVEAGEVFTSAQATAMYLQQHGTSGRSVFAVGETGLQRALEDAGLALTNAQPDWVVVGLDREATYDKLKHAALAIERGARFVGTNPDKSLPTEDGLVPGAGALLAAIEATTGVRPVTIGKPNPEMLQLAIDRMGGSKDKCAMLGDRLDTDIAAAAAIDMPSILVLTGVSKRDEIPGSGLQPSLVVDNLPELVRQWEHALSSVKSQS